MANALRKISRGLLPILALFGLLMGSLYLMSDATQNVTSFGRLYIPLLVLNSLLLLLLFILIAINLFRLVAQVVKRQPGSLLTMRMMLVFVVLALIPAGIVYGFSIKLLERGIDSWFDVRVESALRDALDLSRSSLDLYVRELRQQTSSMSKVLSDVPDPLAALTLNDLLNSSGATEITLFGANSRIIATSGEISSAVVPRMPGQTILRLVSQGEIYTGLDPIKDSGLTIRLVLPVPASQENTEIRVLQVLYPVTERINTLASNVEEAFGKYNELVYLRTPLKQSFTLTLSLVLLLGVLFAVWASFVSSRRLMAPIRELAEGTKAVAAGEYHKKLPVGSKDDLGKLVMSFNQMTEYLAVSRDAAESSQRMVEGQRAYLETILQHLSSGVISLDQTFVLRTVNAAANHILGVDLNAYVGYTLHDVLHGEPILKSLYRKLEPAFRQADSDWQEQLVVVTPSGRKTLICRGTNLPVRAGMAGGYVIFFDDITALIQAQRNAAWGEAARRLAHEIKNPLTPIQLSAERLRKKLLKQLEPDAAVILDRGTHTIVEQVESMKTMVNAFSDYARSPEVELVSVDINKLIADVVELYRGNVSSTQLMLDLDEASPRIEADPVRIRQLLHNLIKNSLEALEGSEQGKLTVSSQCCAQENAHDLVEITVTDNGPGIPEDIMDRLFEPYVTDKIKGNGLGLAIVKKIVEEHNGNVWAENAAAGGAVIHIRLLQLNAEASGRVVQMRGDAA